MLKSGCMAHTLTAPEALAWYFKRRPAFVKDICHHVFFANRNRGIDRKFHAGYAIQAMAEPARVNAFLLQQADTLGLDTTMRAALENDAAEMRACSTRMRAYLADSWA